MSKEKRSTNPSLLRSYAEEMLLKNPGESQVLPFTSFSESDLLKLVHELDVHKIELEMMLDEMSERATGMAAELIIANEELAYQNEEKTKRAAELIIAIKELAGQTEKARETSKFLSLKNKELLKSEEQYRTMIDSSLYAIVIIGVGKIIYANPSANLLFGATSEEGLIGTNMFDRVHPDFHQLATARIKKCIEELSKAPKTEMKYLKLDGSVLDVEVQSSPINYDGVQSIQTAIHDITERKKLEEELKIVSARLAMATHSGGVGVWEYDLVKDTHLCYDQMFALYGIRESDFGGIQEVWHTCVHPGDFDRCVQEIQLAIHGKKKLDTEFRVVWPDGSIHTIKSLASVELDESGRSVRMIGTNWDISEQKRTELEIKLQNEELQKINSEKDKFFSIIAHDMRGPLGGIMGMTEMLTNESYQLSENDRKQMMANLSRSSRNTFSLLENLLEWAQMKQGLTDFKPQELELTQIITECISTLEESAKVKRIELFVQIAGEQIVLADKNMLQSVIRNLISNAIKFTPKGGKVSISAESSANDMMVVSVRDTGIGMTREMMDNLFCIDMNTKRPGTNGEKSTGLGLLLCKEFVEKLGGKITVESEPNKGTVFSFNIPALVTEEIDLAGIQTVSEDIREGVIENLNILIAEDDEISMKLISVIVAGFSKQVYKVKTGDEAVKICRENQDIDLVLMDIAMPTMNGYEATRQIREYNKDVVIIAQTTYSLANDREKALKAGCNDNITKPFSKADIITILQKHIKPSV
jgi:PAS domain S-box-containing protein